MDTGILTLLGGIGLFLFGMHSMTGALRGLAAGAVRQGLARFTRTPLSGTVTGALATATIQSSSATMVTTVGFVGAGLMTFPQAIGVIYGAGIGTTFTGWMILFLGFKLPLSTAALPALFVAALAVLLGSGQVARVAQAVAGLALVFIGLDFMQVGLAGYQGQVTPADFPDPTLWGRLQLVGLGLLVTLITQSSSAGVAGTLVMLAAGALSFPQAAALVVGMHMGTAFTAILAAVGGGSAVRQTALANLIYHVASGVVGLGMIDLMAAVGPADPQLGLVVFHTAFNIIGAGLMLTVTDPFADLVRRLMPEPARPPGTEPLDRALLADPDAALDVAGARMNDASARLCGALGAAVTPGAAPDAGDALEAMRARLDPVLEDLRGYLVAIAPPPDRKTSAARLEALVLQLDRLIRLQGRAGQGARLRAALREPRLTRHLHLFAGVLAKGIDPGAEATAQDNARLTRLAVRLERLEGRTRHDTLRHGPHVIGLTAAGVLRLSDAIRWLRRSIAHVIALRQHAAEAAAAALPPPPDPEPEPEQEAEAEPTPDIQDGPAEAGATAGPPRSAP